MQTNEYSLAISYFWEAIVGNAHNVPKKQSWMKTAPLLDVYLDRGRLRI